MKENPDGFKNLKDIEKTIKHFETSISKLQYADGYFMLAHVLANKMDHIVMTNENGKEKYQEIIGMMDRMISLFERATNLKPELSPRTENEIERLQKTKEDFEQKIKREYS